jgi:excisionase family DNA binding protein
MMMAENTPNTSKEFYRVDEVAARWKVSTRKIYLMINLGEIPAYRIGQSLRIRYDDILEYEKEHQEEALK